MAPSWIKAFFTKFIDNLVFEDQLVMVNVLQWRPFVEINIQWGDFISVLTVARAAKFQFAGCRLDLSPIKSTYAPYLQIAS